jgi:hypothetical protein
MPVEPLDPIIGSELVRGFGHAAIPTLASVGILTNRLEYVCLLWLGIKLEHE